MKVTIPSDLKGKELIAFVKKHKEQLYSQKNRAFKYSDPFAAPVDYYVNKSGVMTKAADTEVIDADTLRVKTVANTAYWMDSHKDVSIPDCWAKTIREQQGNVPHLHDHIHKIDAELGEVKSFYSADVPLIDLGINKSGTTQCLIFETDIMRSYNEKGFLKYKNKRVKQHSIGLIYVKIKLAINDPEEEKEYETWQKYIDRIINKEEAEETGFFWALEEIRVMENSAVLFGSNILTPTLGTESKNDDTEHEPPASTHKQPTSEPINIVNLKFV